MFARSLLLQLAPRFFSFAATANALTVTFASTVSFTESLVDVSFSSSGLNTTLTVGTPTTINQFITVTMSNGSWSASNSPLTATFLFTVPTPTGTTTDSGTVTGGQVNGSGANGTLTITWPNQPVEFSFADGTKLDVTLGNLSVSCASGNNCLAGSDPYYMSGTFLVVNGPTAATPVPAALPLFASGVALIGLIARRRKSKTGGAISA